MLALPAFLALYSLPVALGHAAFFHPSMWGFNVTNPTPEFPYDNRPVSPLVDMTFEEWWFHRHLGHPPNAGDFFELPAGGVATAEIACTKSATSFHATSGGGDIRSKIDPNDVCPGSGMDTYHTTGPDGLTGCALAIAYKDDVNQVQPEDFAVFSVNHTCVFHRFTDFSVPAQMPACPPGGCTCAWFWIHSPDSGSEQNYMNGFKCNVTGATSATPVAPPQLPRRCGRDSVNGVMEDHPGNCTWGAKQPFYWLQKERNNMFEGSFSPPIYTDLYNFADGAQNDIFADSYAFPLPAPGPNQTDVPAFLKGGSRNSTNIARAADASALGEEAPVTTQTTTITMSMGSSSSASFASATTYKTTLTMALASTSSTLAASTALNVSTPTTSRMTVFVTETSVVYSTVSAAATVPTSSATPSPVLTQSFATSASASATSSSALPIAAIQLTAATSASASLSAATLPVAALAAVASGDADPGSKTNGRICKPKSWLTPQRRSLSSFHATTKFSRRKLKDGKSLWHFF